MTANFLYKHVIIYFGCRLTIVINQSTHFINDVIKYLIDHFILKHTNSIVYYPQGNNETKSTNKVFGTLFIKLINENQNDYDKYLSTVPFHNKPHTKLELITHPLPLFMDYIHYYQQNIYYHLDLKVKKIQHPFEY